MRREKRGIVILLIAFLMPHCPVTVVQRYRDGVCSLLFHLFFIICHPYIPLHLEEMIFYSMPTSGSAGVPEDKMQPEQNYNFVEELSDEYYCPILPGELLLEPYQTRCCGKHLSERTVGELYRRSRVCPLCKKRLDVTKDIHFGRRVRELPVFCSNKDRGCRWVAELSALEDHLDECLYHLDSATAEQGVLCFLFEVFTLQLHSLQAQMTR